MTTIDLPQTATLYARMEANLVESWAAYAEGSSGAAVRRLPGVAAAVFPSAPELDVYNNALLARDLDPAAAAVALDAAERAYADAGVDRYAVWAHSSEDPAIDLLQSRGYTVDMATLAMGMSLGAADAEPPDADLRPARWSEYLGMLELMGVPAGLLAGAGDSGFHVLLAYADEQPAAAAIAFDRDGDCGIYNVGTLPHARGRGLATALTAAHLNDARRRGCATASLQATAMAERLYARLGFRDLGRFIEYVPA